MNKMRKDLSLLQIQLISLGSFIGSCYFLTIGDSISHLGIITLIALLLGGFIVWSIAQAMVELSVSMPREGSFVSQAKELIGSPWAASVGWSYWINWCAYVPSEMLAGAFIMNQFFPAISTMWWTIYLAIIISIVNLSQVKNFGKVEAFLSLIKIGSIFIFCVAGILIWLGVVGKYQKFGGHFLGLEYFKNQNEITSITPLAIIVILQRIILILVNYQGTEIVTLSASEQKNPKQNIPLAIRSVSYRIIGLYLIPVLLVLMIMPYQEASALNKPVFEVALERYGLVWPSVFFSMIVIIAAISCANSGIYGAVRVIYSLSLENLAPAFLSKLNRNQVPSWAAYITLITCWSFVFLFMFAQGTLLYKGLLAVSGFTGAICWISITWSQLRFRKRWINRGKTINELVFAAPGFPYLSYFILWTQIACLIFVVFDPELRDGLYVGLPAVLIPFVVFYIRDEILNRKFIYKGV